MSAVTPMFPGEALRSAAEFDAVRRQLIDARRERDQLRDEVSALKRELADARRKLMKKYEKLGRTRSRPSRSAR